MLKPISRKLEVGFFIGCFLGVWIVYGLHRFGWLKYAISNILAKISIHGKICKGFLAKVFVKNSTHGKIHIFC
jgi:hypothetical protein